VFVVRRYALVAVYVSMVVLTMASLLYAQHVAESSARKWCSLVSTLDDAYRGQPPTTPTGERVASDIHQLRRDLRC
jgi:hypothetical protein